MCELLGMSANVPTDICFSFTGLIQRGGTTDQSRKTKANIRGTTDRHRDGWGIAFYEGKGTRMFRDPQPGSHSPIAKLVQSYPIKSRIVISHIRRANRGRVCLENTHPFTRELWGQNWTFAHNGQIKGIKKKKLLFYFPVGTTDSEYVFCWLLDHIRKEFPKKPRNSKNINRLIHKLFAELNKEGIFNVLLSDGESLFAHCSTKLCWITREAPFGKARLVDADLQVDFEKETSLDDVVTVIATRPLTLNEKWNPMGKGELKIFKDGVCV